MANFTEDLSDEYLNECMDQFVSTFLFFNKIHVLIFISCFYFKIMFFILFHVFIFRSYFKIQFFYFNSCFYFVGPVLKMVNLFKEPKLGEVQVSFGVSGYEELT